MTYILLKRALKNIGDFLIFDRAKKLIKRYKKKHALLELNAWEPLDKYLKVVNESDAVIICGGPGITPTFYPGVYPLTKRLEDIKVPIILFGSGWYGFPGDDATLKTYKFTPLSIKALQKIHNESCFISCRDYLSLRVLVNSGFTKVLMTGCPSWYDLEHLNKPFQVRDRIEKIVFTPPQNQVYVEQALRIMSMLKGLFSKQELFSSFHRGWRVDNFTSKKEANRLAVIRSTAIKLGYKVVDAAYDLSNIEFYKKCDLHIGYRLHAHIHFLSQKKPSFLMEENGRGRGFSETVGLLGVQAWERGGFAGLGCELVKRLEIPNNLAVLGNRIQRLSVKANRFAVENLRIYMEEELKSEFARFARLDGVFRKHFGKMKKFLHSLP